MIVGGISDSSFSGAIPFQRGASPVAIAVGVAPSPSSASLQPQGVRVGNGLLTFVSNEARAQAEALNAAQAEAQAQVVLSGLAAHIDRAFTRAREARQTSGVDARLLDAQRRRANEYDPSKLAAIQEIWSVPIWMGITAEKCAAAEAWIGDVLMPTDGKPWTLAATPQPDLPEPLVNEIIEAAMAAYEGDVSAGRLPAISTVDTEQREKILEKLQNMAAGLREMHVARLREEATRRARAMEDKIHDQMVEGGFEEAFEECLSDLVTLGTCILAGPLVEADTDLQWGDGFEPVVADVFRYKWRRVSPFLFYPSPEAVGIGDGYMVEVVRMSPRMLEMMIGAPNTSEVAIRKSLQTYGEFGHRIHDYTEIERASLENKPPGTRDNTIDGLKYTGPVSGRLLKEWGISDVDEEFQYEVTAIKVGSEIVYAKMNAHPLGKRDYSKAVYEAVPGSFWGNGIPHLLRDIQDVCNAAARSLCDNMPFAAGPQVVITDVLRLADGENIGAIRPRRVWQFKNPMDHTSDPIQFKQVDSRAAELFSIYERFEAKADMRTRIPAYSYGSDRVAGAGRTSSGLAMLMGNASKGIKKIIRGIDLYLLKPQIEKTFVLNMLYDPDLSIKGDVRIVPKGALGLFVKEQRAEGLDALLSKVTNPAIAPEIGPARIMNILREQARTLDIPEDDVVPSRHEMQERENARKAQAEAQAQALAMQQQRGAPDQPTRQEEQVLPDDAAAMRAARGEMAEARAGALREV